MLIMPRSTERPLEAASFQRPTDHKLFDNYGPVNNRETIGPFFLGVLAILLFIVLQRSSNCYLDLLEQERMTLLEAGPVSYGPYGGNLIAQRSGSRAIHQL